jgi:thiamine-phosphate pyrophosphorylase
MVYRKINIKDRMGIYIILDLKTFQTADLRKLDQLFSSQISAVQVWDNLQNYEAHYNSIDKIVSVVQQHRIPILMNNRVDLVAKFDFDGVHFDEIPVDWDKIKNQLLGKLIGITCTNDKNIVYWAQQQKVDYVSFCSMFPSANNTRCELVDKKLIAEFQKTLDIPFFLAGGITPENVTELSSISYQGVALVSGLMRHDKPKELLENYYAKMNLNNETNNY